MGYTVIKEALQAAGVSAAEAGEAIGRVGLVAEAARFAAAMPGSAVVGAAGELAEGWGRALSSASQGWARHGEAMSASAETYGATEAAAAESLRGSGR